MYLRFLVYFIIVFLIGCASKPGMVDDVQDLPPTASGDMALSNQFWSGIGGKPVRRLTLNAAYPDHPTSIETITKLDFLDSRGDKYGQRITGLLVVEDTGDYRFWISADNSAEMWLSSDQAPYNKRLIAYTNKPSGYQIWDRFGSQQSKVLSLKAGERYYLEVLHKEYTGEDYLSVAWQGPGFEQRILTDEHLKSFALADVVSGESAYREGYQVGYTSGSYLSQYDDTYPPADSDDDGLPDFYELAVGLNPNDISDAYIDHDNDLLTAYEEYQILTNPNNPDSDGDGMSDGFEFVSGLNPIYAADALMDLDGDGISNLDEFIAGTMPDDDADFPALPVARDVVLSWDMPTQREDGSTLSESDIKQFHIYLVNTDNPPTLVPAQQKTYTFPAMEQGSHSFAISTETFEEGEGAKSEVLVVTVD